jgi:uncharacterized protein (DUF1015 family)
MAQIKAFNGLRPKKEFAAKVAAPPYDVIDRNEAFEMAKNNLFSFLHVTKPEIDLPKEIDPYDPKVYQTGKKNLEKLIHDNIFLQDNQSCFYLYRMIMGDHQQLGLVALASIEDYLENKTKKHELTQPDKENDRAQHILILNAQTGPVFTTYRAQNSIDSLFLELINEEPEYDFTAADNIRHTLWVIRDTNIINKITREFSEIDCIYIADGHHRTAAATRVREQLKMKNSKHTGKETYNYFLTVLFPHDQLLIMDYNRVIKDLNGLPKDQFLAKLYDKFLVRKYPGDDGYNPIVKHDFGMYLDKQWYRLSAIPGTWNERDPISRLDVSILQNNLLQPILGIHDQRCDKRIDFIGGIKGVEGLQSCVDSGKMIIAFSIHPTNINEIMEIADTGQTMPPKSTWFEPKLKSGLVVHLL